MYRCLQNRIWCTPGQCLGYSSDLQLSQHTYTATFADDTAIMDVNKNPEIATSVLQQSLNERQAWMKLWRIMAIESRSAHITFIFKKKAKCPSVSLNGSPIPPTAVVKYLSMHLDQGLTTSHIFKLLSEHEFYC